MKVIISVTRKVQYSSIVEMDEAKFSQLNNDLNSANRSESRAAEKQLNKMINAKDWQDDDFDSVDEFKKLEE